MYIYFTQKNTIKEYEESNNEKIELMKKCNNFQDEIKKLKKKINEYEERINLIEYDKEQLQNDIEINKVY